MWNVYLTNLFKICNSKDALDKSGIDYLEFVVSHGPDWKKNHEVSSESMEAAGVMLLYECSIEKFNLPYPTLIGDGDSSAYSRVCKEILYGPDHIVEKEECVGSCYETDGDSSPKIGAEVKRWDSRMGRAPKVRAD